MDLLYCLLQVTVCFFSGTVSDGEFCSLRTQGETRAMHVWQLIHDAKESVKKKSKTTLLEMLIMTHCKHLLCLKVGVLNLMMNKKQGIVMFNLPVMIQDFFEFSRC